jgi:ATP-dependent RNA helicase DDX54/DBP10
MQFFTCRANEKPGALLYLVTQKIKPDQLTIVFTATRHHVEFLAEVYQTLSYLMCYGVKGLVCCG